MKKVLVILGPTALGKTELALKLAKKFNGELIACDSRQVYKGMDIGTGKMPFGSSEIFKGEGYWIINGIKVWLYDVVSPTESFSVKEYIELADKVAEKILKAQKLPIIVGGSGLYIKALIEGFNNLSIPIDPTYRFLLENLNLENLQKKLKEEQREIWNGMNSSDRANKRRLIRRLEISKMKNQKKYQENMVPFSKRYNILKVGLIASKEVLDKRIDERLDRRIKMGMIKEGRKLNFNGLSIFKMRTFGLEYACLADLYEGKVNKEQFKENLKIKIHQFAKRQITWFKKEKGVKWFDVSDQSYLTKLANLVWCWYNNRNHL